MAARPIKLLILEDSPDDAELILRRLRQAGFEPEWRRVDTEAEFRACLAQGFELVLSDFDMPRFTGLRALAILKEQNLDLPFILISGTIGEETAVLAMKQGATDYLMKDRLGRLGSVVDLALEQARLRRESKRAEAELRASEERLRTVTDNARIGLVMIDGDRRYTFANATYAEILGLKGEILGARVADVLAPLYEEQIKPQLDRAFAGERVAYELRRPTADLVRHYAVRYEPTKKDEKVALVVVVLTEITERKQAEESLLASEERFRGAMESLMEGCQIIGRDWRYRYINQTAARHSQRTREELLGRTLAECGVGIGRGETLPLIERCMVERIPARSEIELAQPDGTKLWFELSIQPVPEGVFVLSLDITERRRAGLKIREQLSELLRWQEVMLNREDRVRSLKAEINEVLLRHGEAPRYEIPSSP